MKSFRPFCNSNSFNGFINIQTSASSCISNITSEHLSLQWKFTFNSNYDEDCYKIFNKVFNKTDHKKLLFFLCRKSTQSCTTFLSSSALFSFALSVYSWSAEQKLVYAEIGCKTTHIKALII